MDVTFVAAVNDRRILEQNLLASPALHEDSGCEVLVQEHYRSAAKAYNQAMDRSRHDLLVFVHQDVYLPSGWLQRLDYCLSRLKIRDAQWGVAGCWGATQTGHGFGHIYTPGLGVIGNRFDDAEEVQTLDEIVLVVRKSTDLRFNENLPHFHFYGADLCLSALAQGMRSYAISAFCIHNSNYPLVLPPEFYEAYGYVKRAWRQYLPIQTPCIRITRFDAEMRKRRIREAYLKLLRRTSEPCRVEDPTSLLAEISRSHVFGSQKLA
jgi:hypothetical protein